VISELDRLPPVACPADHGKAFVLLQQQHDGVEERLVVLGDENAKRSGQVNLLLAVAYPERP
jgi:hypothetical protein